jgi:PAS domain S-box-containing protein
VARTSEFDRSGSVASLERAPDRYLILSPDLDIIGVTQAYLDATMTCRADIVGRHLFDVFPDNPADPAADGVRNLHASLKRVLASGAPDEMPVQKYDVRRPSGDGGGFQEKYWKPLNAPVLEHDGSIAYIVHRVDDVTTAITDRRATATALSDSEENFGFVANNIPQFAWMADTSGSIFWYNRRWFDYTGTTLEQMRGWGWQKVHHPDHVDRVVAVIKHAFDTGEDWEDTFPLRGTDGTYRWFLSRARPIRDRDGMIMRWFGTNTDITEQRQAEQALRESEEFNRRILASSTDCIKVLDLDGKLRFMSEGAQEAMEIDDFASVRWLYVARFLERASRGGGPLRGRRGSRGPRRPVPGRRADGERKCPMVGCPDIRDTRGGRRARKAAVGLARYHDRPRRRNELQEAERRAREPRQRTHGNLAPVE